MPGPTAPRPPPTARADPIGARAVIALGIAALSAAGAALLCVLASGSIGPGRLAEVGPQPGAVALAVGVEVLLGAAILLLSPRRAPAKAAPSMRRAGPGCRAGPRRSLRRCSARADRPARDAAIEADTAPIALVPPVVSPRPWPAPADPRQHRDRRPRSPQAASRCRR